MTTMQLCKEPNQISSSETKLYSQIQIQKFKQKKAQ